MLREEMPRSKDENIFRRTAVKTKAVNLYPNIMRGGIRL